MNVKKLGLKDMKIVACPRCGLVIGLYLPGCEEIIDRRSQPVCPACGSCFMCLDGMPDSHGPTLRAADLSDAQAACVHNWVAATNLGVLCKCSKCGLETPLSNPSLGG